MLLHNDTVKVMRVQTSKHLESTDQVYNLFTLSNSLIIFIKKPEDINLYFVNKMPGRPTVEPLIFDLKITDLVNRDFFPYGIIS